MDPVSPVKTSRYDLHTHSRHSDGTLSPTELVQRAHARGVAVLALTDHDVTDGLTEATAQAGALGMTLIAGVEVSVTWQDQTVHIVGLNIDAALPALQQGLAGLREFRHWRAQEIDRRLARKRILGALEGASRHAHGAILSRTHFARFLVEQGHARDLKHAFKHFLTRSKPGYVPGRWAPLDAAVRWLRDAGGVAVIAHPARYRFSAGKLGRLIGEFKECGGGAIEVVTGSHDVETCRHFGNIACEHGLLASIGSDYHGPGSSWSDLGQVLPLPAGCAPVWQAWADRPAVAAAAAC